MNGDEKGIGGCRAGSGGSLTGAGRAVGLHAIIEL